MDFFSGLKKAYDSLGEEITKTFDSSQSGEDTAVSKTSPQEQDEFSATPTSHRRSPKPVGDEDQSSVYATPLAVSHSRKVDQVSDDGGWGQWESQPLMSTTTKTKEVCI